MVDMLDAPSIRPTGQHLYIQRDQVLLAEPHVSASEAVPRPFPGLLSLTQRI